MSASGKGKKKINRLGSKKNLGQNQTSGYEGAYGNPQFVHLLLSLTGKKCQATVRNGGVYEGLLRTFNPNMDIALKAVHKCNSKNLSFSTNGIDNEETGTDFPKQEDLMQQMVFRSENFVSMKFEDVDLNFAALEVNEMNGELLREQRSSAKSGEKRLEPWNGGGEAVDDPSVIGELDGPGLDDENGWDANEMFRKNEEVYGVKSDYDASLSSYTMPLDLEREDAEKVARATRLAQEIEGSSDYKQRIDLELDEGVTEEDKFSAVVRDRGLRRDGRGGPRDREGEHGVGGYKDKDRSWGDRDRDHPLSPQGYRNNNYDRYRGNRGRGREGLNRGMHQGYGSPNMGHSRSGPGGHPSGGGGRNQPPMSQMDQGGQGKYRNSSSSNIPPRFISKSGSGDYSRNEDRMRHQNDGSAMHSSYATAKVQRQPKRSTGGRWGPASPSSDYPRHSPTQMHPDPAVISAGPMGGNPLSRTPSGAPPIQNHRKHSSTSSQEEQQLPHLQAQQQQHVRQTQSVSSPSGGQMVSNTHQPPVRQQTIPPTNQSQQPDVPPTITWATVASTNPKSQMGPVTRDMSQAHFGQGSSSGLPQQSPGTSQIPPIVSVMHNVRYSWTPPPSALSYSQPGTGQQQLRMPAHGTHMQVPLNIGRGFPPPQAEIQQPPVPAHQQQQQQALSAVQPHPGPRVSQPAMKTPTAPTPVEPVKRHAEKIEEVKSVPKKVPEPSPMPSGSSAKNRNDGMKELQEFGANFKLATGVDKEQRQNQPPSSKVQDRPTQNMPPPQQRQQPFQSPNHQQQSYQRSQALLQQTYVGTAAHQEHGNQMAPGEVHIPANQTMAQQPKGMVMMHRPQQLPHSQIPVASPSIQRFAEQSPVQASPRSIDSPQGLGNRNSSAVQQKPLASPKGEVPGYPPGNVHVHVTGPPTSLANSPAVISVSAASPIVASQYQTSTVNAQTSQQHQRQQQTPPASVQVSTGPSASTSLGTALNTAPSSIMSPTGAAVKALNPEAIEFKPRTTPAKPIAAATRATTPLQQQQGYVTAYSTQGMGGMGPPAPQLMTPVYHTGAPMEHMQAQMPQVYPQFQQQFIVGQQHMVQQIPGQQMHQFATFDQSGQMYTGGPQPIIAQNPRMTAMPGTPQQHMSQYPPDQSQGPVYVPVPAQQSNFIQQQARPHSAHTPTQATHAATASPALQPTHPAPQPSGHPAMVPTHGAQQQQMWMPHAMMVPASQIPPQHHHHHHHQHGNQPAQIAHPYQMPTAIAMANMNQQAKGQPIPYMHQTARPYNQYQSSTPNTQ